MPIDVLYNMEIKICLKKSAKPKRERKKERGAPAVGSWRHVYSLALLTLPFKWSLNDL